MHLIAEIMGWFVIGWIVLGFFALFFIRYLDPFWRPRSFAEWFSELLVWPLSLYGIVRYGP